MAVCVFRERYNHVCLLLTDAFLPRLGARAVAEKSVPIVLLFLLNQETKLIQESRARFSYFAAFA